MSIKTPSNFVDTTQGRSSTSPFVTLFMSRAPTGNDINYPQGQRWIFENPALQAAITAIANSASGGPTTVTANNFFTPGMLVEISSVGGMTQINGGIYLVIDTTPSQFTISLDSSGFSAYTSGGIAVASKSIEYVLEGNVSNNGSLQADWTMLGTEPETAVFLQGNTGPEIPPNAAGVINVVGDGTTITTAGTLGTHTLTISAVGTGVVSTLTGNSGGAVSPTAGNINTLGAGSITVVGNPGTSTLTAQLTGLTSHAVLVGAGTTTITKVGPSGSTGQILQNNAAADPSYSTATYPSTTTINDILYSSSNNVVGQITASNDGVLISGTTGIPSWLAAGTTGQVLIATTSNPASWGTLSSIAVTSITGTANQILANAATTPQTGAVTLTIPTTFIAPGSIAATTSLSTGANSGTNGSLLLNGSTSGTITVQPQAAAGTYNFNLPITAGTSGYFLTSAGGGGSPMTWTNGTIVANSFPTDSGTATPSAGVLNIQAQPSHAGSSVSFSGSGNTVLLNLSDGSINTFIGNGCGNTGSGQRNAGFGSSAMNSATGTAQCIGFGASALSHIVNGVGTIGIGFNCGSSYTGSESGNVLIGSSQDGTGGESNVTRIATGNSKCFLGGITGNTATSSAVVVGLNTGTQQLLQTTITAGTGISVTPSGGIITIAATGSEVGWNDKAISFAAASGQGYFVTANATATLPASPSNGDQIEFFVDGAVTLILQANTGQKIKFSTALSTSAGTMTNTASGDACTIVYRSADTQWNCTSFVGIWNSA